MGNCFLFKSSKHLKLIFQKKTKTDGPPNFVGDEISKADDELTDDAMYWNDEFSEDDGLNRTELTPLSNPKPLNSFFTINEPKGDDEDTKQESSDPAPSSFVDSLFNADIEKRKFESQLISGQHRKQNTVLGIDGDGFSMGSTCGDVSSDNVGHDGANSLIHSEWTASKARARSLSLAGNAAPSGDGPESHDRIVDDWNISHHLLQNQNLAQNHNNTYKCLENGNYTRPQTTQPRHFTPSMDRITGKELGFRSLKSCCQNMASIQWLRFGQAEYAFLGNNQNTRNHSAASHTYRDLKAEMHKTFGIHPWNLFSHKKAIQEHYANLLALTTSPIGAFENRVATIEDKVDWVRYTMYLNMALTTEPEFSTYLQRARHILLGMELKSGCEIRIGAQLFLHRGRPIRHIVIDGPSKTHILRCKSIMPLYLNSLLIQDCEKPTYVDYLPGKLEAETTSNRFCNTHQMLKSFLTPNFNLIEGVY